MATKKFKNWFSNLSIKLKLLFPIIIGIIVSIIITNYFSIDKTKYAIDKIIERDLTLEVKTIKKMFERERTLKLEKVKTDLKIAHELFYSNIFNVSNNKIKMEVCNQITKEKDKVFLSKWYSNDKLIQNNNFLVDKSQKLFGGTATIFQKSKLGYVRISTNVLKKDGTRALFTYIPNNSPVVKAIEQGKTFFGRAYVVNDWYITAYEPIFHNNKIIGMIYVGDKEKDLNILRKKLYELKIGKDSYPFAFDENGTMIMHKLAEGENWKDNDIVKYIKKHKHGVVRLKSSINNRMKIFAFDYFPDYKLYIAACLDQKYETKQLFRDIMLSSVIIGLIIIILFSIYVYLITTENIHGVLLEIEKSNEQLAHAKLALKQSEKLATMGQLSAGIAHELNNPLGIILMYAHILKDDADKTSQFYSDLELMATQAIRCKDIVSNLLNFARQQQIILKKTNVDKFIEKTIKSVIIPEKVTISVTNKVKNNIIYIDENQILQVTTNMMKNAIEAMNGVGRITFTCEDADNNIKFTIADTGPGISPESIDKLFLPFYTTKGVGKGTGLGLSVSYGIIKMHKGKINVISNTDKTEGETGTKFIISLPKNNES
ncbi:MAG: Cache 3/Cache 2 fusion domain-containing protein [Bacteroidetes bacterium]|nr:Cache 3/Cache 2 fusion domain-containing protein [Bacteroidota bacterium]